ncbi:trypsin-like serine protease [Pendulispora brunnea]|uniref:Trypsin-like serine protease n=1 Tax=Pendulispora brunnea TaxID=2905690 RepID=A0ABZ2JZ04_9BACT
MGIAGCATDASDATEEETAENEGAIIGGSIDQGDPGVVLVRFGRGSFCTGEVVSPHVVTTAAHCVKGKSGWTVDTTYDGTGTRHSVKEAHYHPSYAGIGKYDVGVLILNDALSVRPIPLNRRALQSSDVGKNVRIIGYGDSTLDGKGYGKRRQATVKLVSYRSTSVTIGNVSTDGKVQCYGDSGGPALLSIDGAERIIGFDSGNNSDVCDQDDLNTRADTTVGFIDPYIERFN